MFLVFLLRLGVESVPRQALLEFSLARRPGSGMSGELSKWDGLSVRPPAESWALGTPCHHHQLIPGSPTIVKKWQPGPVGGELVSLLTLLLPGGLSLLPRLSGGASSGHGWEGGFQHPEGDRALAGGSCVNSIPGPSCEVGRRARVTTVRCVFFFWLNSSQFTQRLGPFSVDLTEEKREDLEQGFERQNLPSSRGTTSVSAPNGPLGGRRQGGVGTGADWGHRALSEEVDASRLQLTLSVGEGHSDVAQASEVPRETKTL